MKIKLKVHDVDGDMIEMIADRRGSGAMLMAVVHVDSFTDDVAKELSTLAERGENEIDVEMKVMA